MKKATGTLHLIPSRFHALKVLATLAPRISRLIFPKRYRRHEATADDRATSQDSIRLARVLQFNAFLKGEKNKLTDVTSIAMPDACV